MPKKLKTAQLKKIQARVAEALVAVGESADATKFFTAVFFHQHHISLTMTSLGFDLTFPNDGFPNISIAGKPNPQETTSLRQGIKTLNNGYRRLRAELVTDGGATRIEFNPRLLLNEEFWADWQIHAANYRQQLLLTKMGNLLGELNINFERTSFIGYTLLKHYGAHIPATLTTLEIDALTTGHFRINIDGLFDEATSNYMHEAVSRMNTDYPEMASVKTSDNTLVFEFSHRMLLDDTLYARIKQTAIDCIESSETDTALICDNLLGVADTRDGKTLTIAGVLAQLKTSWSNRNRLVFDKMPSKRGTKSKNCDEELPSHKQLFQRLAPLVKDAFAFEHVYGSNPAVEVLRVKYQTLLQSFNAFKRDEPDSTLSEHCRKTTFYKDIRCLLKLLGQRYPNLSLPSTVHTQTIAVRMRLTFGQGLYLTGETDALGQWENALPMKPIDDDLWEVSVVADEGTSFKFLVGEYRAPDSGMISTNTLRWAMGADYCLDPNLERYQAPEDGFEAPRPIY